MTLAHLIRPVSLALMVFAFSSPLLLAQTKGAESITITLDPATNLLTINSLPFTPDVDLEDILGEFGEPDSVLSYKEGELSYVYERLGLVIGTIGDEVRVLGITFTDDGDKHFAHTPFAGTLRIGETGISAETSPEDFRKMKNPGFLCQTIFCAGSGSGDTPLKILIGFTGNEENKLTQVAFLIDS